MKFTSFSVGLFLTLYYAFLITPQIQALDKNTNSTHSYHIKAFSHPNSFIAQVPDPTFPPNSCQCDLWVVMRDDCVAPHIATCIAKYGCECVAPTSTPTETPTITPTPTISPAPTATPTQTPTQIPTATTTLVPNAVPTLDPIIAKRIDEGYDANGVCVAQKPSNTPSIFQIDMTDTAATLYINPPTKPYTSFTISYREVSSVGQKNVLPHLANVLNHPVYAESPEYSVAFNHVDEGGAVMYTINHLQPNTRYEFKAKTSNKCAYTEYGNTLPAKTQVLGISAKRSYYADNTSLKHTLASTGFSIYIFMLLGSLLLVSTVALSEAPTQKMERVPYR